MKLNRRHARLKAMLAKRKRERSMPPEGTEAKSVQVAIRGARILRVEHATNETTGESAVVLVLATEGGPVAYAIPTAEMLAACGPISAAGARELVARAAPPEPALTIVKPQLFIPGKG